MANLFGVECNGIQEHLMREMTRLQKSMTKLISSADPSALMKQLEEDAVTDLAVLGSQYARAESSGLNSDFTMGLIQASLQMMLREISSFSPEVRSVSDKIQAFSQTSFGLIQFIVQLTESSPLVMAAKAKAAIESFLNESEARLEKILVQAEALAEQFVSMASTTPSIGSVYRKTTLAALVHVKEAEKYILLFRSALKKSRVQASYIDVADGYLKESIHTLSPEQAILGEPSTVTKQDVLDLLMGSYSQEEIQQAMRRASGYNQFTVDDDSIAELSDTGASAETISVYETVAKAAKKESSIEAKVKQMLVGISLLEHDIEQLTLLETKMLQAMDHYHSILVALNNPREYEQSLLLWYLRASESVENNIRQLRVEMEFTTSAQKGAKEGWVERLAAMRATLSFLKRTYAQDRRDNANQANGVYFDRYKDSLNVLHASRFKWGDAVNRTAELTSEVILNVVRQWTTAARGEIERQDTEAATSLPYATTLRATLAPLRALQKAKKVAATDYFRGLSVYSPVPPTPDIFKTAESLMASLGLNRMKDMFSLGDMRGMMNLNPLTATYGGAALDCLVKLRDAAVSDAERAKFSKALLFVEKEERRKQFGKTQLNIRSLRAIGAIKAQIESWRNLAESLFKQIPSSWDDPRNPIHAAHASVASIGQSLQAKGEALAATVQGGPTP